LKDSLKFFQAYLKEMIDVGGENLPRAISTKLGTKLGKLYKQKGLAGSLETAIEQIYLALSTKPTINKIDEWTYDITISHPNKIGPNFCVIGGSYDPSKADLFQKNICIPYTIGFLKEIAPDYKFDYEIKQCIVADNVENCRYILRIMKENT